MLRFLKTILGYSWAHRLIWASLGFEAPETSIAEAPGLSTEGDQCFKIFLFEANLNMFLLPRHETLDWGKGIHQNSINEEWR